MSADQIGVKKKYLLVTTTGPAAGSNFGLYREAGTHHGAPYSTPSKSLAKFTSATQSG